MDLYLWNVPSKVTIRDMPKSSFFDPSSAENAKAMVELMYSCLPFSTLERLLSELGVDFVTWIEVRDRILEIRA